MVNFLDNLLKKMGIWFGIIFKVTIPALLFFYPSKMIVLGAVFLVSSLGINLGVIGEKSQLIAVFLYVIFVLILIFMPKVASVIEFVATPIYLVSLYYLYQLLFKVQFYSLNITDSAPFINMNKANVVLLAIFIFFKILFFFFVVINKNNIEKAQIQHAKSNRLL
jgi:hypothetical protein